MNAEQTIEDLKKELRKRKRENESLKTEIEMLNQQFKGPKNQELQSGRQYLKKLEEQMLKSKHSQEIIFSVMQTAQKITHALQQTLSFSEGQQVHTSSMESILNQLENETEQVSLKLLEQKIFLSMDKLEMVVGDFRLKFQQMKRFTDSYQKVMEQIKREAADQIKNLKKQLGQSVSQSEHLSQLLERSENERQIFIQSFKKVANIQLASLGQKTKTQLISIISLMVYRIKQVELDKDQIIKKQQKQREKLMVKYKQLLNQVKGMRHLNSRSMLSSNF